MSTHKFESLAEFGRACKTKAALKNNGREGWTSEKMDVSLDSAINGSTKLVADAEKLLDKLQTTIELQGRQWQPTVAGAFPSVPDYIAGHPESMRKLDDCKSESTPVRVWVCTTSSAHMEWQTLQKRGVAVLAAVMAISQQRPVELWTFTALDGKDGTCNVMVRINSQPLQLSEACYALTSIGFDRNLTHGWGWSQDRFTGSWSKHISSANTESQAVAACRKILGSECGDNDLIIPPSMQGWGNAISNDSVKWVNSVLEKYTTQLEESQ